ncbi:hypothetical protein AB0K43_22630 [Kitasatospora sp. NPDC049258]|uniref:hypothetical protein n=1 Tax=Kitasatospora sp. NPDC049258 TaxID=3155394 RepID=UPI003442FC41
MRLRATLLAATATAALTLCACSGGGTTTAATGAPSSATGTTAAPIAPSEPAPQGSGGQSATPEASKPAPPSDAGLPPAPDGAATAKLIAALDAIDPEIVAGKPEKAVDAARNQCQAIFNFPKDRPKLVELTNQRFTSPAHPNGFGPEKADKILTALQSTLCTAPR